MKQPPPIPLLELAIVLFSAWLSRDILTAWCHSPRDQFAWLAMIVWLAPLAMRIISQETASPSVIFLTAAILIGACSGFLQIHALGHIALVLAMAARITRSKANIVWMISALAWMPLFGWGAAGISNSWILIARLALAIVGMAAVWPFKNPRTVS